MLKIALNSFGFKKTLYAQILASIKCDVKLMEYICMYKNRWLFNKNVRFFTSDHKFRSVSKLFKLHTHTRIHTKSMALVSMVQSFVIIIQNERTSILFGKL